MCCFFACMCLRIYSLFYYNIWVCWQQFFVFTGKISISLNSYWPEPYSNSTEDHDASERILQLMVSDAIDGAKLNKRRKIAYIYIYISDHLNLREKFELGPGFEPRTSRFLVWSSITWAILLQLIALVRIFLLNLNCNYSRYKLQVCIYSYIWF